MLEPVVAWVLADIPASPVVGMMTLGVVVAVLGHMAKNYRIVTVGIAVLFLATALMIVGAFAQFESNPRDPRPQPDYTYDSK